MRIACVATKGFEDHELADPKKALEGAGHKVDVIAPKKDEIAGYHEQVKVKPDKTIDEAKADDYDALFVPGGFSPDQLRADDRFVKFVQAFANKPILAICHGPQLLFLAGLLDGKRCTAWKTIQFDLKRGGIDVVDQEVVVDSNLVTSRKPQDIPAFSKACIDFLQKGGVMPGKAANAPTQPGVVH